MTTKAANIAEYIDQLPDDRKEAFSRLRDTINTNLPEGFKETLGYNMPSWVVPHSAYPAGYHCDPKIPLPFLSIASQKNFIAFYHMGLYADNELLEWFVNEYPNHSRTKLDMGKSCVRFKKVSEIPYDLIAELCAKMTPDRWIGIYESNLKK
jgi:uncharacterized protein YdhG (YjbR/CyaY superfamily)